MTDRVQQQVLDYLLGTLDESEMDDVRSRLKDDPVYRRAMRMASGDLGRLSGLKRETPAPPRLAERTVDMVFDPVERLRRSKRQTLIMTPPPSPATSPCRLNWVDAAVAGVILIFAALLIVPAINGSRFQARVTACQDNLHNVGQALTEYSHRNNEVFPPVPVEGNLAADGIWAPVLQDEGFLIEPQKVLCPESPQVQVKDFHIPSLDDLRKSTGNQLARFQQQMGGSYGYCLGYFDHGKYQPTQNLNRAYFAILADAPTDRGDHHTSNHSGLGQNVLFEDLHVEFCSTTRPGNGRDDIYVNDNNDVAPGLHRDDSVLASSGTAPIVFISLR